MFKLLKYELTKLFWLNKNLYIITVLVGLADVYYLTNVITGEPGLRHNPTVGLGMTVMFLFMILTMLYPIGKSIFTMIKDHTGRTASLESHIPYPGWMKVLSKMLADTVFVVVGYILAYFVIFTFVKVGPKELTRDWDQMMTGFFDMFMKNIDMRRTVFTVIFTMFVYAMSLLGMVALFSSVYGALRNKVTYSKVLAFVLGVLFFVAFYYLNDTFKVNYNTFNRNAENELVLNNLITKTQLVSSLVHAAVATFCVFISGWIFDRYSDIE